MARSQEAAEFNLAMGWSKAFDYDSMGGVLDVLYAPKLATATINATPQLTARADESKPLPSRIF